MSSEDKTLEPSDQGPSPAPASSTAATPAGSPAIADKRPRGRPRKDGVAPIHKSKKKSRSRGKASVDDEDSMDGVETAETESVVETETKEQPLENEGIPAAEEKLSSPVLSCSVSEESAGAPAGAATQTKSSEQLCAFCNCGERSLLGQGELKQFSPSPGYTMPRRSQCRTKRDSTGSNEGEGSSRPKLNSTARRQRGQKKDASPRSAVVSVVTVNTTYPCDEPASKFWDELSQVGLPEETDLQSLSDPSGHCWAHQCCAAWSEGVCREQEQVLVNVDKAVDSGSTTHCAYCKRLGATIKCCEEKCTRLYHYPCAAAAGTFQDIRSHTLLCPEHIEQATGRSKDEANCALCDSPGDLLDQLFCTSCGQHYHGMCLDIGVTPLKRAGWQCPDCKVCQTCKNPGEDSKMLVCDTCDKGYHTFCLQPVMDSIPTNSWRCKNCRVCEQCGTRTSSQWHHNCLLCDNCYQQQDAGLSCPLCGKAFHPDSQKDMLCCQMCKRWIHLDCDRQAENETSVLQKDGYVCTICQQVELEELQASQTCEVLETAEPIEEPEPACLEREREAVEEPGSLEHAAEENQLNEEQKPVETAAEPAQEVTTMAPKVSEPPPPPPLVPETEPQPPVQISETEKAAKQEALEEVETAAAAPTEAQLERELQPQNSEVPAEVVPPAPEEAGTETEAGEVEPMEVSAPEPTQTQERQETVVQEKKPLETPALAQESLVLELIENHEVAQVSDSSLLVEMDSTPASEPSFSDMNSSSEDPTALTQQSPERSFSVSMDTSKLAEPPVSVGTPPKDVPQVQAAPASSGGVPSTTFIPVAPKIGMGKPAITKRTFSPGRPRVRQGAWSTRNMSSSPSWSPDSSEGWDPSKTRQLFSTPIWTVKVEGQLHDEIAHHMQNRRSSYMTRYLVTCSEKQGRGSGFPGRRRPRGAGVPGRGGRGRSKLKNAVGTVITPGVMVADTTSVKDEEENSMHNTVVLFSSSDRFTMKQDMCVVCGSFGRGPEGRLLACAQCGQCYHPYCVSVKITKVVLSKGWRCLECTVCEACGKATDPGRLLLCDDCDISYHTYCLDPPLQTVPKGGWKCKWCVSCTHCGATSPGLRCEWQNNYTQCAPCGSLATCPVCSQNYKEDELIVQCRQCDRWIHASCQNLNSEEELENAADNSFDCAMCRIYMTPSHGSVPEDPESPGLAHIVTKVKEQDPPKTYTQDGVCLTEVGLSQLQSLTVAAPRRKRPKPKLKLKIINQNSVAVLQTPPDPQSELSRDGDLDDSREGDLLDCDGKSDSSPEREAADDDSKGAEGAEGIKKRKRKPYRPGIGGFMVRQRSRTGQGKAKRSLCRKDSSGSVSECLLGKEESWNEPLPDTPAEETAPGSECLEKAKKRYRKKKNKLEEVFPAYLQEAFFGRNLLDTSRQSRLSLDALSDEDLARIDGRIPSVNTNFLDPSSDPLLSSTSTPISAKPAALSNPEDPLAALSEVLNTDDDILGILSDELVKPGENSAGLDVGPVSDDSSLAPLASTGRSTRPPPEEPLGRVLSPELDTMVTDGAILSKLYKIPELEGKDVEELFTAVLSPSANQTPQHSHIPLQNQGDGLFPRMPIMNGLMGPNPHFPSPQIPPGAGPCIPSTFSPIHRPPFSDSCRDKKPQFNELVSEAAGSWAAPAAVLEAEADTMSNAQRSTLKWEKEETLGEMATVAPVLYTNMNFPSLKEEFPEWSTRVKQIAKLWRKASSQERAPYVQKARDNRAALRINKVQMSNDTIKRQQHHQEIIDPNIPIESDLLFKDPLKPKESEHEQEWKFRQQLRQKNKQQAKIEATQKLEQVKSEQQQQLQQQQSSGQSGSDSPNSGNQSPLTPQPSNGNMSPAQETMPKDGFATPQPPGTPTASSSNDVFLRPQAPPPTPTRIPVQDPFSQAQPAQPQSPQMFSPGSSNSRPSSPWDPYAKMVGTPRPPAMGPNPPRRKSIDPCTPPSAGTRLGAEQQERNRPSPAHESFVSPSSINNDPYSKPPDTPRPVLSADLFAKPMGPPRTVASAELSGKLPLGSTAGGDTFARPGLRAEVYQRMQMSHSRMILSDPYTRPLLTPIPGSNESGSVSLFKAPMPPSQSLQDPYPAMSSTLRRMSTDPYQRPVLTPRPADGFSQNQMNDPFAQPPLTPCPVMNDTFSHPPRMSRQSQRDPFSQPGPIARPQSQDLYAQAPLTPGPAPLQSADPYSQPPSTPRPRMGERFAQSPIHQRNSDQYAQPPGTQRPVMNDPYSQPPGTPRPGASETFNRPVVTRPGLMPNQDPFSPAPQNRAAGTQETFVRPSDPCSQTSKLSGMTEEPFAQPNQLNQTSIHDLYEQPPMTPRSQSGGVFDDGCLARDITEQHGTGKEGNFGVSSTLNMPGLVAAGVTSEAQNNMHISQGDTEEKLRQRLRLREIILRQQQQKIAVRQEKVLQDPALSAAPGTPRHWSQEDPNRPNEPFNRPPPPYPGTLRGPLIPPGAQRFPGPFPNDPRGSFPRDRVFNRPPCTGDVTGMGMRPRFGFPPSGQGPIPSQERFLSPPHQMQGSMSGFPQQLRRSLSVDLPRPMGNSQMNNPIGLHPHFPPRGMQMQQHNIMGQPFIELRHRAPESRLRLQFGPSIMAQENVMDPSSQRTGGFMTGQEMGFSGNQGSRLMEPMMNQHPGMISHMQMSTSFEHIPLNQMQMHTGHPHAPLMRSLSHPVTSETFSVAPLDYFPSTSAESTEELPLASQDVIAEKLDPDDSAVKDLDDVEVKDLDDEDLENLNLDPEDGKGDDLDLETNDLHLDDFLRSGKFDIIAYTDPELDLGDKKDMFNEELDLSDPIEDHPEAVEEQKTESKDVNTNSADVSPKKEATSGMKFKLEKTPERLQDVKQESSNSNENTDPSSSEHTLKTEAHAHAHPPTDKDQSEERNTRSQENTGGSPSLSEASAPSSTGTLAGSTPALPSLLIKDKVDNTELGPLGPPTQSMSPAHQNHLAGMPQNPNVLMTPGQMQEHAANPNLSMDEIMDHTFSQGAPPPVNPNFIQGQDFSTEQQIGTHIPMVNQSEPNGMSATEQALISQALSQQNRERPLLLDEQPLLLQDLLDQERQEQQQQRQMQAMIRQRSSDSFFPNIDFDAITDPIMKAKMVALKGINKVMVQNSMGMPSMVMNRFQFVGQQMPEPEVGEGVSVPQQAIEPDGKLAPQMARPNPPSFDPGFVNDAQKKQYEEWLQDTQQLLQMQQKFLEEQIGVHRKSKKALSAKQRTAKKAGREFPEDDAEQLKHVTEQQSVVQKQLEQIRKQQKEHAELIEEYRIKQQQQGTGSPALIQGVQSQAPMVPGGPPPVMTQQNFPILPQQMEQHLGPIPGQPTPPRMPGVPGWHPGAPVPMAGLRMQSQLPPHIPVNPAPAAQTLLPGENAPQAVAAAEASTAGNGAHVKFDDNNPFSEGFQERERKERLRELQERQRIQLMQEVERQRALQQRLELEQQQQQQQGIVGPDMSRASLSQMPYFNSELPHDFMQRLQQQQLPTQQQMGKMFPQQQSMQQGFISPSPGTPFAQGNERRHIMGNGPFGPPDMPVGGPNFQPSNQGIQGANFVQGQPRPPAFMPAMSHGTGEGPPFGMEPVTPLPPSYPGSGQSLIQLYSNIIPEEKGKKKRNRKKKKKEDDADSVKAPSTPHSDLTTPLTPSVSDTASTPTRIMASDSLTYNKGEPETAEFLAGSSTPRSGVSQPPTELERQLSASSSNGNTTHQQALGRQSSISSETDQQEEPAKLLREIKLEQMEATECRGPRESKVEVSEIVKLEGKEGTPPYPADHSPAHGASGTGGKLESGNELLKHLLKNKNTPSLLPQQRSEEEEEEEEEGAAQSTLLQKQNYTEGAVPTADNKMQGNLKQEVPRLQHADREQDKKKQRYKRAPKSGEKPAPRPKKRKKNEDDRHVPYPNTDSLMSQLKQQLSLLPLMEPLVGVNFAHFPPYGSGRRNGENRLTGTFGSASLDGVSDYYSQLIYKQNNLSNPPTPPASLPPTPPPVARQKMVNGFATAEELASKAGVMRGPDVTKGLGPRQFQMPFRPEEDLLARALAHGPKTVDVPASLPTPPHNNQEELRGQDHCDERDSPDSFVPSSSPESVLGMEVRRYPDLSLVKQEPPDPAPSPVIPILPSCSGKGSEFRRCDVKMEPSGVFFGSEFGQPANCSQAGLVSIAITLNPAAAGNINGVVAAVADLLRVKLPNSYEASAAPDRLPAALLNSMKMQHHHRFEHRPPPLFSGAGSGQPAIMRFMRPSGPSGMFQPQVRFAPNNSGSVVCKRDVQFVKGNPGPKPQWCCHCKVVVLGNGVCKSAKDLPFNKQDLHEGPGRSEGNMVFCSHNCFVLYSTGMQAKATETQEATSAQLDSTSSKTFHQYSNNTSTLDVHCLPQLQPKESPATTSPITFPPAASEMMKLESKPDELKVTVKLKPRARAVQASVDESRPLSKRWKGMRWRKWSVQIMIPKGNLKLPCEGEITELLKRLGTSLRPEPLPKDHRKCCFCHEEGDGITDGPARLLNLDLDLWVHLNCALWSSEVYETQAGALINVELALRRGLSMKCLYCQKMGATSGCQRLRCTNIYHFTCALRAQCMFFKDKTMLCHMHRPRGGAPEHELRYFAVFRRVYVQRDEVKQIASIVQRGERDHTFRVGSLIFHAIGQLLPQQMKAFHTATAIFPVGYEASRLYWSMRYSNRRCQYICSIDERDSQPEFIIRVVEQGHEDLVLTDTTPKGVWDKVLEPVAERRNESGTLKLFQAYLKGEDLFGLTVSAVVRIAESLPGVEACGSYIFRYGRNPLMELPLSINPTGSARSQPKTSSHVKRFVLRPHTLNSTSTSKSFQSTVTGELNAPYSKQFVHSKSSQYRKMKTEWKGNVYLARSRIQGLGLYAARDIEKHTMVIEYMGTVIRNEVANRKEKHYESQNRGVFMFRMDSEHVIDATLTGGPARYINHSCAPNCVAEVVTFEKGHKIIISSNQRIHRGQELCYDYKFDFEDDQHKIPCHCGAVNCRKWMN